MVSALFCVPSKNLLRNPQMFHGKGLCAFPPKSYQCTRQQQKQTQNKNNNNNNNQLNYPVY